MHIQKYVCVCVYTVCAFVFDMMYEVGMTQRMHDLWCVRVCSCVCVFLCTPACAHMCHILGGNKLLASSILCVLFKNVCWALLQHHVICKGAY